tara:strand:- start:1145 stop:1351 length:207 start_codon:yes stop_codon:yes gene_type:complete
MRIFVFIILFTQVGCGGIASFVSGVAGNLTSDAYGRIVENKECMNDKDQNDTDHKGHFIFVSGTKREL